MSRSENERRRAVFVRFTRHLLESNRIPLKFTGLSPVQLTAARCPASNVTIRTCPATSPLSVHVRDTLGKSIETWRRTSRQEDEEKRKKRLSARGASLLFFPACYHRDSSRKLSEEGSGRSEA